MEIRTTTAGQLEKQRVAIIATRLKELQAALQELDASIADAEAVQPSLEQEVQKQEQEFAKVKQSTGEQMKALGLGPKADLLAKAPQAAQTEFEHRLQQSEVVQAALNTLQQARGSLKDNKQGLQRLRERQAEAATVLERFISRTTGADK